MKSEHFLNILWRYGVPLLAWMIIIFVLSAMPGSGSTYSPMPVSLYLERKGAHVAEYFVLTVLAWRFFRNALVQNETKALLGAVFFSLLYAISDEFHQSFVFGREGKGSDVFIDSLGIALATLALRYHFLFRKNRKTLEK
jgi:VanZ family protein